MANHGERAHSKFSASGSERWLNCSASVHLEEQSPPSADSVWSLEGTEAHEVLEVLFKMHQLKAFKDVHGKFGAAHPEPMIRHGLEMVRLVMGIKDTLVEPILLVEERVYNTGIHPEMFGTVDAALVEIFGTLHVFDYKYGSGHIVDPVKNTQLIQYALALAEKYDWAFTEVVVHICQPRSSGSGHKCWALSIDELKSYRELWLKGVARVEARTGKPFPGSWCHWCRAKAICPAKQSAREEKGTNLFANNPLPERKDNGKNSQEKAPAKSESKSASGKEKSKKVRFEKIEAEGEEDFF